MKHVKLFEEYLFEKEENLEDFKKNLKDLSKTAENYYSLYWKNRFHPERSYIDFQYNVLKHKGQPTDQIEKKMEALDKSNKAEQNQISSAEKVLDKALSSIKTPKKFAQRYEYEVGDVKKSSGLVHMVSAIASLKAQASVLPEYLSSLKKISAKDLSDSKAGHLSNKMKYADEQIKIVKSSLDKLIGTFNNAVSDLEKIKGDDESSSGNTLTATLSYESPQSSEIDIKDADKAFKSWITTTGAKIVKSKVDRNNYEAVYTLEGDAKKIRKSWSELPKEIEKEGPESEFADLEFFGLSIKS